MIIKIVSLLLALVLASSFTGCKLVPKIDVESGIEIPFITVNKEKILQKFTPTPTEIAKQETEPAEAITDPLLKDSDFVEVKDYIPEIYVELKYATADNFTGHVIYEFQDAYLRYGTVKKLIEVSDALAERDIYLKIWDAFRPPAAQFKLWEICPDPDFVANPNVKYSSHSRGNTVDVTLVDVNGAELEMPSGFDDFSALADRDYSDCSSAAKENALLLQKIMEDNGFSGYRKEWWHFSDKIEYPAEEHFDPAVISG